MYGKYYVTDFRRLRRPTVDDFVDHREVRYDVMFHFRLNDHVIHSASDDRRASRRRSKQI